MWNAKIMIGALTGKSSCSHIAAIYKNIVVSPKEDKKIYYINCAADLHTGYLN